MTSADTIPVDAAGDIELPIVEILTGRGFITGKSGSGKSNTASVIAEELLDQGFPFLIVDTDGEYWGLKEQFEILHVGADEECDLRVGAEHAVKLAQLALDEHVPIILDVSGYLDRDDADAVVRKTIHALYQREKKRKRPFLVLVEEIHEYIPQRGGLDETGEVIIRVAKRGRKRGLGLCGLSQRPASVDKDFITQCDWLFWHRLSWKNDTDVVRQVVGGEFADTIEDLADGEAFLMADFLEADVQRVQVRRKHTFDAGATPDLEAVDRPDLKSVSGDLVDELEQISEREEQRRDRIAQLESELERKEARVQDLEQELDQARDMRDMAQQFVEGLQSSGDGGEVAREKVDELLAERAELRETVEGYEEEVERLRARVSELSAYEERVERLDELNLDEAEEAVHRLADALGFEVDGEGDRWRGRVRDLQERVDELEAENERLRERPTVEIDESLEAYEDFLALDVVKAEIEAAKQAGSTSQRYIKGVLAAIIAENGWVDYTTIAERLGISDESNVSKAASELARRKIVRKDKRDGRTVVDLNVEGINEIRRAAKEREKTEELMEDL